MDDTEQKMDFSNDFEPEPEEAEVLVGAIKPVISKKRTKPEKIINKVRRKRGPYKSRKPKWFIEHTSYTKSKDGEMGKITKISKRKYTKSKNEYFGTTSKSFVKHSIQNLIPVKTSNGSRLLPLVNLLEKHNFQYEVMPETVQHENIFLQDKYMNSFFENYPEYMCIDFLCEIPELELNLCLFTSIDGNGFCEIVTIGLLKNFDAGLSWLLEVFKKHNPNWRKTKIITCDKKDNSINVSKMAYPDKLVLVSFFHSLKALKKEISNLNCELSEQEMNDFIQIYEKMVYACDDNSYDELSKEIKPDEVSTLFKEKWHNERETWGLGLQLNSKLFLKSYHSFLIKMRKEIRPAINMQDSIESVIEKLCVLSESFRNEKFQKFTSVFSVANLNSNEEPLQPYTKFLTQFSTELVLEQFNYSNSVKNIRKLSCGKYVCASEDIATIHACSCNFFQEFLLPCCHIFAIRMHLSFPFFAETLCSPRWTSVHYQNTFLQLQKSYSTESINSLGNEKFEQYFKVCSEIWPLLIECSENVSQDRFQILYNFLDAWNKDLIVSIKEASKSENSCMASNSESLYDGSADTWKEMHGVTLKEILNSDYDFSTVSVFANHIS